MRYLALAFLLLGGNLHAADPADAGLESYALTMDNVRKMARAFEALDAAARKDPALAARIDEDAPAGDVAKTIATFQGDATIKQAVASAGISVRDAVLTHAALAAAAGGAFVQQQTGKPPAGTAASVANIKLYQDHRAELETINERLRALGEQPADDEDNEDEVDE